MRMRHPIAHHDRRRPRAGPPRPDRRADHDVQGPRADGRAAARAPTTTTPRSSPRSRASRSLALLVAASALFRGGRVFPATFIGVALGMLGHALIPALPFSLAVACGVLGVLPRRRPATAGWRSSSPSPSRATSRSCRCSASSCCRRGCSCRGAPEFRIAAAGAPAPARGPGRTPRRRRDAARTAPGIRSLGVVERGGGTVQRPLAGLTRAERRCASCSRASRCSRSRSR